jgi:hypothetical protein
MDQGQVRQSSLRTRTRPRFSRTFSVARRVEYRTLLRTAIGKGYTLVPLERYLDDVTVRTNDRVVILRHDVDQRPTAALEMAEVERELGVRSTWYFRWRTADVGVVAQVSAQGGEVGLHYETLTRRALAERLEPDVDVTALLDECRTELQAELTAFRRLFGPVRSVAAHGDSRVPWVRNLDLLEGVGPEAIGARYDANLSLRAHRLGAWVTDRSVAEGSWGGDRSPYELLDEGCSPLLCLTHPNNWVSGPAILRDRILAAALPDRRAGHPARIRRALPDTPPSLDALPSAG